MTKIVDLSMKMEDNMFTFPGNKPFQVIGPYSAVSGKNREYCYELGFTTQTGTHIQGSHYFLRDGKTIDTYPLEIFEGEIIKVDLVGETEINNNILIERLGLEKNLVDKAVLLHTGYMEYLIEEMILNKRISISDAIKNKPGLTLDGAKFLTSKKPKILGIDSFGFEPSTSIDFEVNHYLCEKDIVILEGLVNLGSVFNGAWLEAFPLSISGVEGTPCRAIARI